VLAEENVGFSLNDTEVPADAEIKMWYANHIEAVYVIEGPRRTGRRRDR
jgi:hypothetical protein